ncbi:hypothetical protein ACH4UM_23545 [Streptomyces sp. NPDC020801]|uniref:hypothetical protein n=1 Tax=unclassified Streptomyces TaxID=2593676 RepID=UPI003791CA64
MPSSHPSSPLIEHLDSAVNEIHVMPGFGNRLTVLLYKGDGIPEPMTGAVASVTVYGDGRISYEPIEEVTA